MLREHAAVIEWPPLAWLKEKYPGRLSTVSADAFASVWLGYTLSWEALLAAWDEGGCAADNDSCAGALCLSCARPHPPSPK